MRASCGIRECAATGVTGRCAWGAARRCDWRCELHGCRHAEGASWGAAGFSRSPIALGRLQGCEVSGNVGSGVTADDGGEVSLVGSGNRLEDNGNDPFTVRSRWALRQPSRRGVRGAS